MWPRAPGVCLPQGDVGNHRRLRGPPPHFPKLKNKGPEVLSVSLASSSLSFLTCPLGTHNDPSRVMPGCVLSLSALCALRHGKPRGTGAAAAQPVTAGASQVRP